MIRDHGTEQHQPPRRAGDKRRRSVGDCGSVMPTAVVVSMGALRHGVGCQSRGPLAADRGHLTQHRQR